MPAKENPARPAGANSRVVALAMLADEFAVWRELNPDAEPWLNSEMFLVCCEQVIFRAEQACRFLDAALTAQGKAPRYLSGMILGSAATALFAVSTLARRSFNEYLQEFFPNLGAGDGSLDITEYEAAMFRETLRSGFSGSEALTVHASAITEAAERGDVAFFEKIGAALTKLKTAPPVVKWPELILRGWLPLNLWQCNYLTARKRLLDALALLEMELPDSLLQTSEKAFESRWADTISRTGLKLDPGFRP